MYEIKLALIVIIYIYSFLKDNNFATCSKLNTTIETIMLHCINICHDNVKF